MPGTSATFASSDLRRGRPRRPMMQPCRSQGSWSGPATLALASEETEAKELLLSLMPQIEAADRDDWMLETLAQLGELYLVRTAYDGVREGAVASATASRCIRPFWRAPQRRTRLPHRP